MRVKGKIAVASLALLGSCLALPVMAATAQETMKALFDCQLRQHELLTAYHFYSGDAGDPANKSSLQKAQTAGNSCVSTVESDLRDLGMAAAATSVRGAFSAFNQAVNQNTASIVSKGAPENEVLNEMVRHGAELQKALEDSAKQVAGNNGYKLKPAAAEARRLAVLVLYANAKYIERTTAAFGITYRDDSREQTIDALAREFDKGLAQLGQSVASQPALKPKVAAVVTKWRFIEGSLVNYNEKTVPFTVNRHARSIAQLLSDIASTIDSGK